MRAVDRRTVSVPATLAPTGFNKDERDAARTRVNDANSNKKAFEYKKYKADDVRAALEQLFHGKCAYCETFYAASAPVDVEHFRPKGAVAEDEHHGGYWWLAASWTNLLPCCIDCNRKRGQKIVTPSSSLADLAMSTKPITTSGGKKDSFPIGATGRRATAEDEEFTAEIALLVDPTVDDPSKFLGNSFDSAHPAGLMVPAGDADQRTRGAVSIQVYGLNRLKLIQDRTRLLRRLEFMAHQIVQLSDVIARLDDREIMTILDAKGAGGVPAQLRLLRDRTIAEMKTAAADDAPYSSLARAWIERFKQQLT